MVSTLPLVMFAGEAETTIPALLLIFIRK